MATDAKALAKVPLDTTCNISNSKCLNARAISKNVIRRKSPTQLMNYFSKTFQGEEMNFRYRQFPRILVSKCEATHGRGHQGRYRNRASRSAFNSRSPIAIAIPIPIATPMLTLKKAFEDCG
jgi:hypothetical protein